MVMLVLCGKSQLPGSLHTPFPSLFYGASLQQPFHEVPVSQALVTHPYNPSYLGC
jgi:hypothetical protein